MSIYNTTYKNVEAVALENDFLRAILLPSIGGKIASLIDRKEEREYLYQPEAKILETPAYGSSFHDYPMFGFDDMFPTITAHYCETEPWRGSLLPDHGEVWALPWEHTISQDSLRLWVYGIRIPYLLEKRVSFSREDTLLMEYRATNLTPFSFPFIWAGHPLFSVEEGMKILLPQGIDRVMNVEQGSKRLGSYGQIHSWPEPNTNLAYRIDTISSYTGEDREKVYVLDELPTGWAALVCPTKKKGIALSFPKERAPYLGIWINEGGYYGQYNMAIEPCTGAFDRVDEAVRWNRSSYLNGKSAYSWHLSLTINTIESLEERKIKSS